MIKDLKNPHKERNLKMTTTKYYRVDIVTEKEVITVCTTTNYEEACRQYDVWSETHPFQVQLFRLEF